LRSKVANAEDFSTMTAYPVIIFWIVQFAAIPLLLQGFLYNYHNSFAEQYSSDVAWFAPFYSGGGYCSEARSFIVALDKVGFRNFSIVQHGDSLNQYYVQGQHNREQSLIAKYDKMVYSEGYPKISVCHSEPGAWYVPTPRYHTSPCPFTRPNSHLKFYKVGRTMFETDSIPSGWAERLNVMDEIWVPTEQSKVIFENNGVHPQRLKVIPETVDTEFYQRTERRAVTFKKHGLESLQRAPQDTFNFLFVGKFEPRKGIDILMEAFFKEFSSVDRVQLLLLTSSYHSSEDFDEEIQSIINTKTLSKRFPPRYIILSNVDQAALPALYSYADVLVSGISGRSCSCNNIHSLRFL
jgi:glycosyltransferase involved in cell wall biosynthesis